MSTSRDVLSSTHLSSNRVWGQLGTTTPADVLDGCRARRVTGEVVFHAGNRSGKIELRAGRVEHADLDGVTGEAALAALAELREGTFEVVQRLPGLEGALGSAAEFQGDLAEIPLIQIMRHVETHALTVTITVIHEWDRGVISYKDGDIAGVEFNGDRDPDRIGELVQLSAGRFRVLAGALELPVPARRATRRAPTEPFHVGHVADLRRSERRAAGTKPPPVDEVSEADAPAAADATVEAATPRSARARIEGVVRGGLRRLIARARDVVERIDQRLAG